MLVMGAQRVLGILWPSMFVTRRLSSLCDVLRVTYVTAVARTYRGSQLGAW